MVCSPRPINIFKPCVSSAKKPSGTEGKSGAICTAKTVLQVLQIRHLALVTFSWWRWKQDLGSHTASMGGQLCAGGSTSTQCLCCSLTLLTFQACLHSPTWSTEGFCLAKPHLYLDSTKQRSYTSHSKLDPTLSSSNFHSGSGPDSVRCLNM